MNAERRKTLERVMELIAPIRNLVEDVKDEEESAFYSLPESLQGSERGQALESNVESLEEALSDIDNIIEILQIVIDK